MGCCAATREGLADLEVVLGKEESHTLPKDSFVDISLNSDSSEPEMPEAMFVVYGGESMNLEKYLSRGQRSWTFNGQKSEGTEERERKGHTRAASMGMSFPFELRPEEASTNASGKCSFNNRFLTSK